MSAWTWQRWWGDLTARHLKKLGIDETLSRYDWVMDVTSGGFQFPRIDRSLEMIQAIFEDMKGTTPRQEEFVGWFERSIWDSVFLALRENQRESIPQGDEIKTIAYGFYGLGYVHSMVDLVMQVRDDIEGGRDSALMNLLHSVKGSRWRGEGHGDKRKAYQDALDSAARLWEAGDKRIRPEMRNYLMPLFKNDKGEPLLSARALDKKLTPLAVNYGRMWDPSKPRGKRKKK